MGLYIRNSFASVENNHPYQGSMPDRGQVKVTGVFQQTVSFVLLSSSCELLKPHYLTGLIYKSSILFPDHLFFHFIIPHREVLFSGSHSNTEALKRTLKHPQKGIEYIRKQKGAKTKLCSRSDGFKRMSLTKSFSQVCCCTLKQVGLNGFLSGRLWGAFLH